MIGGFKRRKIEKICIYENNFFIFYRKKIYIGYEKATLPQSRNYDDFFKTKMPLSKNKIFLIVVFNSLFQTIKNYHNIKKVTVILT